MSRFPDGARVVFIGDSIVAENLALQRIIDFYNKKFKGSGIRFFNCGIAGGTAESALRYFENDIMRHAPTHAVLATGVNDSERWHLEGARSEARTRLLTSAFEAYKERIPKLAELIRSRNIELTICTPLPYDEYTETDEPALRGGYPLMLGYADFVRSYAEREKIPICDYYKFFQERIQTESCYSHDHIHPNSHGYYLLAKAFLSYQGLDVGKEEPIPSYFTNWASKISILRTVFAAEYMLVKNTALSDVEKVEFIKSKIEKEDWGQPVFEKFMRCYAEHKPHEDELYETIEKLYEDEIFEYYLKNNS